MNQRIVGFYSPHLCVRGTEVAMYDYAYFNEVILGNKSVILYHRDDIRNDVHAIRKFSARFDVVPLAGFLYDRFNVKNCSEEVNKVLEIAISQRNITDLYIIKGGWNDGVCPGNVRTLIHCIACAPYNEEKHGTVYAYGSEWLSEHCSESQAPVVPYMINVQHHNRSLRDCFGIPENAVVLGRHGGYETFDLPFVKNVLRSLIGVRPDLWILFMNTERFYDHERIIHLPRSSTMSYKTAFINTCDYMLHARYIGESFGLACGEFSVLNKPIITWSGSEERHHIRVLGDSGIYYKSSLDLFRLLLQLPRPPQLDHNRYRRYEPRQVMDLFHKIYLSV